jgi:hypothetical protein
VFFLIGLQFLIIPGDYFDEKLKRAIFSNPIREMIGFVMERRNG